ncbi:30S ribosomal protein S1 [Longimonas halophila]|uniref:Small ribosomal subunit protein bS1 n=1 Tax=Longimonas halophila TaxID=1469170 RepID=A0A2H3P4X6_9BACT|nr:30S ribosomal protein S1 [Longimonas halophila]PEN09559.1 30S ribosomal protein S1 [Longimonas halophila]
MAEQEKQAPPQNTPDADDVATAEEAEAAPVSTEADAADPTSADALPDEDTADVPDSGAPEADASDVQDADDVDAEAEAEDADAEAEVVDRDPPPENVDRLLAEAVATASEEVGIPTSDDFDFDATQVDDPGLTVSLADLERTEENQGFSGQVVGRTVTLDELEEYERSQTADPVYDQFRDLVDRTSIDVREQDIVQGRVLKVSEDHVVIDIGYKSDGIVSRDEFGEHLQRGDTVEVYLDYKEDREGQLVLSKEKADKVRRWQRIEEIYENEEIVEGTIIRRIKGGMIVELFEGLEAFLPGSQIDVRPVRDFDAYLEKRMEFRIVKLNPSNENIVVSHRELIQEELEEQRQQILSQLEVGQVLQGTVKNIVDFGVFIDLGGVDGLLHITDLSWGRVSHPSEVVELDQEIQVVVLDYEEERQRISLGLKQLQPHPWDDIGEKYDEDETVEGKVVSITNYGAFVELEKGIEGLVHISEMSWTRHINHPSQMVSLGQLVEVKILNIDEEDKKISLGMKQLEPDPWDGISDRYPAGTVLTGTVRNITNFGVFVEIEPGIDGLVHISDLSWTKKVRHPGDMVKKGQDMDVQILNIDEDRRRISLGHKQVKTNPWDQFESAYSEGTDTEGEVVRVEDKGLVVELPLDVEAFVPGSELKNGPRDFQNHYFEGDELELRVIRFDKSRKDIVLSETAKERQERQAEKRKERQEERREKQERRQAVDQYTEESQPSSSGGSDDPDPTSGPTTLGELSGLGDLKREMQAAEQAAAREADIEAEQTEEVAQAEEPEEAEATEDAEAAEQADEAEADDEADEGDDAEEAGFPDDFPHVSRLESAGVTSLDELRSYDDFEEIDGIGSSYAEDLRNALDALENA